MIDNKEEKHEEESKGGTAVVDRKPKRKLKPPSSFKVLLHNDDYTPMEFVVFILKEVFHRSTEDSIRIMTYVHEKGIGTAGTYSYQLAEQKVYDTMLISKQNEFPLQATYEEI